MGKKLDRAIQVSKKIASGTKTVLNALPTVNTEKIEHDFGGQPFKNQPEHFYNPDDFHCNRSKRKKKHNIANVNDDYLENLL